MQDDHIDISLPADYESRPAARPATAPQGSAATQPAGSSNQPAAAVSFLGIEFACCRAYARVYLNSEGTAYTGRCPRCMRNVRFEISAEGQAGRFFVVS